MSKTNKLTEIFPKSKLRHVLFIQLGHIICSADNRRIFFCWFRVYFSFIPFLMAFLHWLLFACWLYFLLSLCLSLWSPLSFSLSIFSLFFFTLSHLLHRLYLSISPILALSRKPLALLPHSARLDCLSIKDKLGNHILIIMHRKWFSISFNVALFCWRSLIIERLFDLTRNGLFPLFARTKKNPNFKLILFNLSKNLKFC